MTRIGIDARFIFPNRIHGIGRYSYQLIRHLARIDRENEYVLFKSPAYGDPLTDSENFREVPVAHHPISLGTLLDLSRRIRKEGIAIFHSLFPIPPLFLGNARHVVTVHDLQAVTVRNFFDKHPFLIGRGLSAFHRLSYSLAVRNADRIISVSETTRKEFIGYYSLPPEKIVAVHHGIEPRFRVVDDGGALRAFRKKYDLPQRFVLNVGNTKPHKNVGGLLKSFRRFLNGGGAAMDLVLVIVGGKDRFLPDVLRLVDRLGVTGRVLFPGYIPDEEMPLLYNCAELFVIVSVNEGFGFPVVESMACGTPVIAARAGALPEIGGDACLLVDPDDPGEAADAMYSVLSEQRLYEDLKERGLNRSKQYSWHRAAEETLRIYTSLTE